MSPLCTDRSAQKPSKSRRANSVAAYLSGLWRGLTKQHEQKDNAGVYFSPLCPSVMPSKTIANVVFFSFSAPISAWGFPLPDGVNAPSAIVHFGRWVFCRVNNLLLDEDPEISSTASRSCSEKRRSILFKASRDPRPRPGVTLRPYWDEVVSILIANVLKLYPNFRLLLTTEQASSRQ